MRQNLTVLVLVLAVLVAAGPGRPARAADEATPEQRRVVTDMCGRQVSLPARIRHVVTAGEGSPAMNAHLFTLGLAGTIANGLPTIAAPPWKYQLVFAPQMAGQPSVSPASGTPFWEVIESVPNDVVLVKTPAMAQLMEERGLTAVCLSWRGPEGILTSIRSLGEIMDAPEQVRAYLDYYQDVVRRVAEREGELPANDHRTVLYLQVSPLSAGALSTASTLVARAGGHYAALPDLSLESVSLDPERLLALDPDLILVRTAREGERLRTDPRFAPLRAVANDAVVVVPYGALAWTHATPEQALGILWLAKRLYPDRFADVDMVREAGEFYRRFFHTELREEHVREILREGPPVP